MVQLRFPASAQSTTLQRPSACCFLKQLRLLIKINTLTKKTPRHHPVEAPSWLHSLKYPGWKSPHFSSSNRRFLAKPSCPQEAAKQRGMRSLRSDLIKTEKEINCIDICRSVFFSDTIACLLTKLIYGVLWLLKLNRRLPCWARLNPHTCM